jgi:hypothetical protein
VGAFIVPYLGHLLYGPKVKSLKLLPASALLLSPAAFTFLVLRCQFVLPLSDSVGDNSPTTSCLKVYSLSHFICFFFFFFLLLFYFIFQYVKNLTINPTAPKKKKKKKKLQRGE